MGISEQSTLLCEQKLLTSRQIFRYAVPARTVTKKALDMWKNNCTKTVEDQSLVCNITVLDFRYLAQFQNRSGSKANGIEK